MTTSSERRKIIEARKAADRKAANDWAKKAGAKKGAKRGK